MNKNKFRNIKKQKNRKNKEKLKIVIIEQKQQSSLDQCNKIWYLVPLFFLLFNSNLFIIAPFILVIYSFLNKPNQLISNKEFIDKNELFNNQNTLNKDKPDILFLLPILFILFILFFIFFYVLFSYLRMKTSLPCIQSCESIINSISSNE